MQGCCLSYYSSLLLVLLPWRSHWSRTSFGSITIVICQLLLRLHGRKHFHLVFSMHFKTGLIGSRHLNWIKYGKSEQDIMKLQKCKCSSTSFIMLLIFISWMLTSALPSFLDFFASIPKNPSYAVFSGLIVLSCAFVCATAGSINQ